MTVSSTVDDAEVEVLRDLQGAQPEVIRAIWCAGSALHHNPR